MPDYNKKLTPYSQNLRKKMTDMERKLWYEFLSGLSVRFRRQKPIGAYIVDFYCSEAKLVIELDGSQHYEKDSARSDVIRDDYLKKLGLTVLRYADSDVGKNFSGVCDDILAHLQQQEQP